MVDFKLPFNREDWRSKLEEMYWDHLGTQVSQAEFNNAADAMYDILLEMLADISKHQPEFNNLSDLLNFSEDEYVAKMMTFVNIDGTQEEFVKRLNNAWKDVKLLI